MIDSRVIELEITKQNHEHVKGLLRFLNILVEKLMNAWVIYGIEHYWGKILNFFNIVETGGVTEDGRKEGFQDFTRLLNSIAKDFLDANKTHDKKNKIT